MLLQRTIAVDDPEHYHTKTRRQFGMEFEFFSQTDTGRVRSNNEDAVALDESVSIAVLADGMGGYNAGEVASGMACDFIKAELGRWLQEAAQNASDSDVKANGDLGRGEDLRFSRAEFGRFGIDKTFRIQHPLALNRLDVVPPAR